MIAKSDGATTLKHKLWLADVLGGHWSLRMAMHRLHRLGRTITKQRNLNEPDNHRCKDESESKSSWALDMLGQILICCVSMREHTATFAHTLVCNLHKQQLDGSWRSDSPSGWSHRRGGPPKQEDTNKASRHYKPIFEKAKMFSLECFAPLMITRWGKSIGGSGFLLEVLLCPFPVYSLTLWPSKNMRFLFIFFASQANIAGIFVGVFWCENPVIFSLLLVCSKWINSIQNIKDTKDKEMQTTVFVCKFRASQGF